mgnify:CR=1 FL=1
MIDMDFTLAVQAVNFLITLFVFNFLVISPIRGIIKKRNAAMADMLSETEKFNEAATSKLQNYEAALAEARAAGTEERLKVKDAATAEEKKIVEAANSEAQDTLAAARSETADQVKAASAALKAQVDSLAEKTVSKVLG